MMRAAVAHTAVGELGRECDPSPIVRAGVRHAKSLIATLFQCTSQDAANVFFGFPLGQIGTQVRWTSPWFTATRHGVTDSSLTVVLKWLILRGRVARNLFLTSLLRAALEFRSTKQSWTLALGVSWAGVIVTRLWGKADISDCDIARGPDFLIGVLKYYRRAGGICKDNIRALSVFYLADSR
eukprot:TRINITY_DN94693_c0_g1_i1.p2 TRINITY_DN94693_c0_g1~~TRINITY_DN94693_c0_g1_i1.p2  ORF type:complete len:182 (+),score=17.48 TRINITY_DN94693_c0_g1_i1:154-699(+)